jgi:hypothetical protein
VVDFTDTFGPIPNGLGSPSLNSEGNTSIQTVFFDAGTHTISATYGADFSFNSSMSMQNPNPSLQSVTFTIQPGFFTSLVGSPAVVINSAGLSGSIPLNVYASTGFSAPVSFSCSGLPAESTCTFSPTSITGTGQTTLVVSTTAPHVTQLLDRRQFYLARWLSGGSFALAGFFLLGSPRGRRRNLPFLLTLLALVVTLPACGGGSSSSHHQQDPGTPSGSYTVRVTATASGAPTQTSSFALFVQ